MFKNPIGNYSSKRIMGVIFMMTGLISAVIDQMTEYKINSFDVWLTIVVAGSSLLGVSIFDGQSIKGLKGVFNSNTGGHPDPKKEEK